jgi:hypothetical protein
MTNFDILEIEESSGNVFADLEIPNPDEYLAKAKEDSGKSPIFRNFSGKKSIFFPKKPRLITSQVVEKTKGLQRHYYLELTE